MANNFQQNYTHSPAGGFPSRFGHIRHTGITYNTKKVLPPASH